jgi:hypothetical protein
MKRIGSILTIIFSSAIALSQVQLPIGQFDTGSASTIDPGLVPWVPRTMEKESDKIEVIKGFRIDLNGDGEMDLIQEIYQNCGTGGCSFFIYDGASTKRVGELFGSRFFISQTKINGWPVLEGYHHAGSASGMFSSYVYDGSQYVNASSVYLYGKSADELFKRYSSVQKIRP